MLELGPMIALVRGFEGRELAFLQYKSESLRGGSAAAASLSEEALGELPEPLTASQKLWESSQNL